MKHARIENHCIIDIAPGEPGAFYPQEIAALYDVLVPDTAGVGDMLIGDSVVKKVEPRTATQSGMAPPAPKLSPVEFKLLFTPQERIAIKAARLTDPVLADGYEILEDPRLTQVDLGLGSVRDLINYMVGIDLLTPARRDQVLSGQVQ